MADLHLRDKWIRYQLEWYHGEVDNTSNELLTYVRKRLGVRVFATRQWKVINDVLHNLLVVSSITA